MPQNWSTKPYRHFYTDCLILEWQVSFFLPSYTQGERIEHFWKRTWCPLAPEETCWPHLSHKWCFKNIPLVTCLESIFQNSIGLKRHHLKHWRHSWSSLERQYFQLAPSTSFILNIYFFLNLVSFAFSVTLTAAHSLAFSYDTRAHTHSLAFSYNTRTHTLFLSPLPFFSFFGHFGVVNRWEIRACSLQKSFICFAFELRGSEFYSPSPCFV